MKLYLRPPKLNYLIAMKNLAWSLRASLLVVSFSLLAQQAFSQSTVFQLTPKENAFMCPFLTPIFMKELTEAGAEEIRKDQDLIIHFKVPTNSELDSTEIYRIAGEVGFQSKIFTLQKTEE
jgi:hypothetical protein